ncbi:hypothetical protein A3B21_03140 [Candidatus Uhrbacteria bacterium RIFCSPLOWO2_01_FULL_47_24]|uniref:Lumazine-binding domain-containing protein n=1 Tax=Candidatus Uhrbacteria bacterium RIFCSPLOWO2_01_FULL_47_24 TaxID=1802401 RepID=A0A1F7URN5_9BACT|nr:MAG: hypothetical protein A2753_05065 [Candidatus Uhrbacteria bacterium RIFCSPHIGHO2_01_FULL_47_11]OGL67582.1 MAG: hypothetical protein A3D58_03740 [Candidatus Uhrbacteria bacterium RIFCSPHIGHO2_02_FULL_46_47]OGL75066.1 MAG: hypothetical protein A3F52_01540 [Candidatus Uhrbacteria bacterium RIFCSPHIGHO2_12_FULL_47_11]OGL80936.1 MAG: hypothetical protein A3B21_03140 [Candidatus Uhrbacteria bacterium RIFCSPLOWO2_01_FULL_47_24]OGL84271.1 MAG: hypothetical protein A3J03_03140 [Candidatus Uhrbact
MFTGIIQATGTVVKTQKTKHGRFIKIKTDPKIARTIPEGGSVAIDGVCLTSLGSRRLQPAQYKERKLKLAPTRHSELLTFELMDSTLKRTTLGARKVGDRVNVEPALTMGQPLGGHFISGHVDGMGVVRKISTRWHTRYMVIDVPRALTRYLVPQGSVVVNGVSLTIVEAKPPLNLPLTPTPLPQGEGRVREKWEKEGVGWFSVALTSYTLKHTNLAELKKADRVNIEVDMLAKYMLQFLNNYEIRNHRR